MVDISLALDGGDRKFDRERAAVADAFAFGEGFAAVAFDDGAHDEQTQAGALDAHDHTVGDAVETFEDTADFRARDADAAVAHAHGDAVRARLGDFDLDAHLLARVLDRVIEQVQDDGLEFVGVANDVGGAIAGQHGAVFQGLLGQAMTVAGEGDALLHKIDQIDARAEEEALFGAEAAGAENLLDSAHEAVG